MACPTYLFFCQVAEFALQLFFLSALKLFLRNVRVLWYSEHSHHTLPGNSEHLRKACLRYIEHSHNTWLLYIEHSGNTWLRYIEHSHNTWLLYIEHSGNTWLRWSEHSHNTWLRLE